MVVDQAKRHQTESGGLNIQCELGNQQNCYLQNILSF